MEDITNLQNDDRPLSPVLNSRGSSQKAIFSRKRSRLKSKVNLIDRFSSEQTTASSSASVLLGDPKLLDNMNVGKRMQKIKEKERQRKFGNHFYSNQESDSNIKTEVTNTFDFNKPVSPISTKHPMKSNCNTFKNQNSDFEQNICEGFRTGSGKKVITSFDSFKKHSALFEDILTPKELERNLSKSNLVPKISTDNSKSQNVTLLQTSVTDTQFNFGGDIPISVDFDSWTNAEFDTSVITNNNKNIVTKGEDNFKDFDEPLTKIQLSQTSIENLEEEILLSIDKANFPRKTNIKRGLSFTSNPNKRFKFNMETYIPSQFDSAELLCCDDEGLSKINEVEINAESSNKSLNIEEEFSAFVEKPIEAATFTNNNFNAGGNFSSGFSLASGKNIEKISSKAWKRAGNILKEDNLPAIDEKQSKSKKTPESSSHQGFSAGDSKFSAFVDEPIEAATYTNNIFNASGNFSSEFFRIEKLSIKACKKAGNILKEDNLPDIDEIPIKSNKTPESSSHQGFSVGGSTSASEKNIAVSNQASNILQKENLPLITEYQTKSKPWIKTNLYEKLSSTINVKSKNSVNQEIQNSKDGQEELKNKPLFGNVVPKKRMPFKSPMKVSSNENFCHESKSTPAPDDKNNLNNSESSVDNLHTPKNDMKRSTVSKSIRKRLGVSASISKQTLVHKENIQRAYSIFEESANERPTSTNVTKSNIYSSTPVKKCDVITKPNTETFKNESICLNNVNLTPIRNSNAHQNVIKEVKIECKTGLLHNQDGDVIFKKCSTLNTLEHINSEYQSLELQLQNLFYKKQVLESQRGFLTSNKNCSSIRITQGVLTKKKFSQQRISWDQYLGNVEPGNLTIPQALENGVSSVVLAVSPNNATDVHFSCDRNDQHKSVVHTEDGAIVVSNSKNLVGLMELTAAFEMMPGVEAKLLPRNWISNHFKWIVWKLASLERNFPDKFANFLSGENVVQQLKHRYDREIDNAERPALRKILEKDDVPQKKMVLCVADIIEVSPDCFEMELTDGWYSIRTIIDRPLCKQVKADKIVVGTKLITQCAELLNCDEGCHPLEASDSARLKIFYNCTRRAKWNSKLGYQRVLEPFPIRLHTILPDGGCIGCIQVFIARVYPLKYMEKQANGLTVTRNKRAEDKRAQEWDTERTKAIESIQHKVQRDFEAEMLNDVPKYKTSLDKQTLLDGLYPPNVLLHILENTNDPEGFNSLLSTDQLAKIMDYKMKCQYEHQQDLSSRMDMELKNLKLQPRNVTPVLKLCVTELNEEAEVGYTFNIYKPTEEHLQSITEGSSFSIYNVLPKHNGEIGSNNKTHFKLESTSIKPNKMKRSIIPIASLHQIRQSVFNEFDTIGTIVQLHINDDIQKIWLTDFDGNLLLVKVVFGPDKCSLLDNLNKGHSIAIVNLISCASKYGFEQAIANQSTLVTKYPRHSLLQELLLEHCNQLGKDLTHLMNECDKKIEKFEVSLNGSKSYSNTSGSSLMEPTVCNLFDDSDVTEIAMSLIDTDQYFDNSNR